MTSKQAIDIFKEKYPHKKPIGYWIDGVHPHHLVLVILKSASTLCLQMARSSLLTLCAVK